MKKEFIFILVKPDGSEYKQAVSAASEAEAERRLKNLLDIVDSEDRILRLQKP